MNSICIIVPVYNVEKYIRRCIDSILNQTFADFKLILIDDGSPDNCPEICDEYATIDSRIIVIHQINQGLSAARNVGIEYAISNKISEWITFIDSDDWIERKFLESLYLSAVRENVLISVCNFQETDGEITYNNAMGARIVSPDDVYFMNSDGIDAHAWGKLYKLELFTAIRFPVGKLYEDLFVIHEILFSQSRIVKIDSALYYYYKNTESIVRGKWTERKADQILAYECRLLPYFKALDKQLFLITKRAYIKSLLDQIDWAKKSDRLVEAKKLQRKALFAIVKYNGLCIFPIDSNSWRYEKAFPKVMRFYWMIKSIIH